MRNKSLLPIRATLLAFALLMLGTTSCTKEDTTPDMSMSEEAMRGLRADIIGSWELMENGYTLAPRREQILNDGVQIGDSPSLVQWTKTTSVEKRVFQMNGTYNQNGASTETCKGAYQISNLCVLTVNSNCQNPVQTIQELTNTTLIVKEGVVYFKYRKLN